MLSDGVLTLDRSRPDELPLIAAMEQYHRAAPFIIPYSLDEHRAAYGRPEVLYYSLYAPEEHLIGFVILVLDTDGKSVEFRRIVIEKQGRGLGHRAMALIEDLCRHTLRRQRLWLDVFADNARARHLYEAHGYRYLRDTRYRGRILRVYEKNL